MDRALRSVPRSWLSTLRRDGLAGQRSRRRTEDDNYAWHVLGPLTSGYPYLPFSGATARPLCLVQLLNEIVVNDRRHMIEFGAGLSTVLVARLLARHDLDASVVSVEHDGEWLAVLAAMLASEHLADRVELIHAPLGQRPFPATTLPWYDADLLERQIGGLAFDLAFIDGPPAWERGHELARYPAVPFLLGRMRERFSIVLDDADRPGERDIMARWEALSGLRFVEAPAHAFAVATSGPAFYTEPLQPK